MGNNGIGISVFSLIMAIICFNLLLLVIAFLRRNTMLLVKNSTSVLLLILLLGIIRLFVPIDMPNAAVIHSDKVMPGIQNLLGEQLFGEITLWMALGIVWILGVAFVLLRAFFNLILEVQRMKRYKIVEDPQVIRVAKELNLKNAVIVCSPGVDVPKVIGIFKAYIYLPSLALYDEDLKLVLRHEYQHLKGMISRLKFFI